MAQRGSIAWMARNSVAANLLMFIIIVGGLLGLLRIKQEVFPEFDLDVVRITVPFPGAAPGDVEQRIVLAVEEAVQGLDGVKRVTSNAQENRGDVAAELVLGADPDKVLADVKSAVDRIGTFPEEAEKPTVALLSRRQAVVSLILSGDQDLSTLHALAERARVALIADDAVTQVEVAGVPPLEVSVEVRRETLQSHQLTLDGIALQIAAASLELPGGAVETGAGEVLIRLSDRKLTAADFADIVVTGTPTGARLRLGDIADIRDGYEDTDQAGFFDGRPAVMVTAYRVGDETPKGVAAAVHAYAEQLRAELAGTVQVDIWDDDSVLLQSRIDLLVKNALFGGFLVVIVLALFLDLRLAFWVALGIPISFLGAFLCMPGADVSVNMVSLFALIVTLGMVVDDAIIVGENAYDKMQHGLAKYEAAVAGAREMAMPVTFAILTTIAAFSPMFFVPGVMGKIFRILPAVVLIVLVFSLIESFWILPAHLAHGSTRPKGPVLLLLDKPRAWTGRLLDAFIARVFRPVLGWAIELRYMALAAALALFAVSVGLVGSGLLPFNFFPTLEGDVVTAAVRFPYGSPIETTEAARRVIEDAAHEVVAANGGDALALGMYTRVGEGPIAGGPAGGAFEIGSHLVTVELNLVPTADRDLTADDVATLWAAAVPPIAGVDSLVFESSFGPGAGAAVDVQLSHPDVAVLAAASAEMEEVLRSYPQLINVQSTYAEGKAQLDYHLRDHGRSLGLTGSDVARQLRSAFYGAEGLREQRGRNEVKVMVRLPAEQRRSEADLGRLRVRTPSGGDVPLAYVADFDRSHARTEIARESGQRVINVSAELAPAVKSSREVLAALERDDFPALLERHPGLKLELVGAQREQQESFRALGMNYVLALFVIYALLAIPFKSYTQPLVVMAAIPFGFVGAVAGHVFMGYSLSIISLFGIVALSGVVVNDSLVLIDTTNRYRAEGRGPRQAVIDGAARRIRPILLTSLTTFFGLLPMIFETDVQAQFLIPMAISLGYGVLFATVIILIIVPALYMILEDVLTLSGRAGAWLFPEPQPVPTTAK